MADELSNPENARTAMEESRRELEALTYTIAHDLRAPLRTIEGFARALSDDHSAELDADGRRYLQHVLDASHRMSGMLEGLLALGRIHRAQLRQAPVELAKIAREIVERLHTADPLRAVTVTIPDGITADADATLLTAALEALLQNAWKFTRGREPALIEVGVEPATPPVYFVRDNGVGFDMRYAEKLFGPFQRFHSEKDFAGLGIGLATVQRIVRRHGGRVWAETAPGRGATFRFTLKEGPGA